MMLKNFDEIKQRVKALPTKKIAIAVASDEEVLAAARQAQDEDLAQGILTGDEKQIREIAEKHQISLEGFEILHITDPARAAAKCCELVREGQADAVMKGLIDTSLFMKAVLNKEKGLNAGGLISHLTAFEVPSYPKLLIMTDAAINIAPELSDKVKMINNAVKVSQSLGVETPLVACCAAVEKVNPKMPATMDAAILAQMSSRGQIKNCIVDGPFALDNAVSEESARIKKINSPVAGKADIILCNDIEAANYLYKCMMFLARAKGASVVMGTTAPIILTSRADSHESKYLSIVLAALTSAS